MNSGQIFEYSDDFIKEIIDNLILTRLQKISNSENSEFNKKLRSIIGKNFDNEEFKNLISLKDKELKEKIIEKFESVRNERIKLLGENQSKEIEKRILLQAIDLNWKSHIQYLEQLRQVIGLRSYGQRDPLIEYKKEAFELFSNLLEKLKMDYVTILINLKVVTEQTGTIKKEDSFTKKTDKKIGRNDSCPCGSKKKYKHCCGRL